MKSRRDHQHQIEQIKIYLFNKNKNNNAVLHKKEGREESCIKYINSGSNGIIQDIYFKINP